MPRHIHAALDQLIELEDDDVVTDWTLASARPLLEAYAHNWRYWHDEGFEIEVSARHRIRLLWGDTPHLRHLLRRIVANYPCDELEGICHDLVERLAGIDFAAWCRWAPRLEAMFRNYLIERARRFNDSEHAMIAGMMWARHLGGGDEAYRAVALAFNRADRKHRKFARRRSREHFLRHCFQEHGELTEEEMREVNRHLLELDGNPLEYHTPPFMERRVLDPIAYARMLADTFERRREVARAFAGEAWSAIDDALYDAARVRLDSPFT